MFKNAFASGIKSIEGLPSITASIPTFMNNPLITSKYAQNNFESLASLLNKEGYKSSFFHGGFNGTMGFDGLGGPVKITQEAGKAARYGLPYFLGFMATISTILGFMNILPIPGLDGGHAFMTIIEGVSRRKIPINIKMTIQSIETQKILG